MSEALLPQTSNIIERHSKTLTGPTQLSFDITNKCNFKCLHCFNRSSENFVMKDELTDEEVMEFVHDLVKIKPYNICFCGGEPLLRDKLIYKAASILSKAEINVSMVTNGSLMTKEKAIRLKESGALRIQVSLDGATKESYAKLRQSDSYDKAVNAIKYLKEVGINDLSVSFTPTSFNVHEFKDVFKIIYDLGAKELRVQPIMIIGRAKQHISELEPSPLQYRNLVKDIYEIQSQYGASYVEWGDPVDHLLRFRSVNSSLVTYLTIKANGGIACSPYIPLIIGNIKKYSLSKYWNAGLIRIWEAEIVQKMAANIKCMQDFGKEQKDLPIVWFDEDIYIDMIDNNLIKGA